MSQLLRAAWRRLTSVAARQVAGVLAAALLGGWLGLLVAGSAEADVGPVRTRLSLVPTATGDTTVRIPPLGELSFDAYAGLLQLQVDVQSVDVEAARRLVADPARLDGLEQRVADDLRAGITRMLLRSAVAGVAGAGVLALILLRRPRLVLLTGGLALAVGAASGALAAATFDRQAIAQPRFTGLLATAPQVVGNVQDVLSNIDEYGKELARLVTNVSKLYDVTSTLPVFSPDDSTIRVLHVADIHLNPSAWMVIRSLVRQFRVDAVIDSGDLTDRGSAAEDRFATSIASLGVPYLWVRGNHDSASTQAAVARTPNALVLDDGAIREVEELRITGDGDPRFTPDRSVEAPGEEAVVAMGELLAEQVGGLGQPVDIAVVHDPAAAAPLDGVVPLVLAGHGHRRETEVYEQGTRMMMQGSTGGAGLRALEGEEPTPVTLTVLYFDRETRALQAWDEITLGGLGLTSAEIERRLPEAVSEEAEGPAPGTAPRPPGTAPRPPGTVPRPLVGQRRVDRFGRRARRPLCCPGP